MIHTGLSLVYSPLLGKLHRRAWISNHWRRHFECDYCSQWLRSWGFSAGEPFHQSNCIAAFHHFLLDQSGTRFYDRTVSRASICAYPPAQLRHRQRKSKTNPIQSINLSLWLLSSCHLLVTLPVTMTQIVKELCALYAGRRTAGRAYDCRQAKVAYKGTFGCISCIRAKKGDRIV